MQKTEIEKENVLDEDDEKIKHTLIIMLK